MAGGAFTLSDKLKQEPLIPLGVGATIGALAYATWAVCTGRSRHAQVGMRGRVVMQGLTIAAMLGYGLFRSREKVQQANKDDIRPINWEKLEREAQEAEAKGDERKRPTSATLDKIIARAKEEKSVFAKEEERK